MKFKIHFIVLNLLVNASIFCMETNTKNLMELDDIAIEELIKNQKDILELCKKMNSKENKFLQLCSRLSKKCNGCILSEFNKEPVKNKIEALDDYLNKQPRYQTILQKAKETNTDVAWTTWRTESDTLMWSKLAEKKIVQPWHPDWTILSCIATHSNLTSEQEQYLMAKFFLTMKKRQMQREITGKSIAPIVI